MPVLAEELTRFKAHRWQISCLEFNHDGTRLASGGWDKEVHIWDLGSLSAAHTLKGSRAPITCLGWYHPNSGILCTGSADQTASLWNAETGKHISTLGEHSGWVLGCCFSADGSLLATASWDKTIRIWDVGTATLINNLNEHTAGAWSVNFHPDSPTLCSGGQDGSVIIWDARSNKPVRNLSYGHTDAVYSAKWSPDGALIASGSADTKVYNLLLMHDQISIQLVIISKNKCRSVYGSQAKDLSSILSTVTLTQSRALLLIQIPTTLLFKS